MTSLSTAYVVAPTAVDSFAPPVLVNTSTSAALPDGTTNVLTSAVLPVGTYLVGANFQITTPTNFAGADTVFFYIRDTAGSLTNYPLTAFVGGNHIGTNPAAMAVTLSGVLVLAVSGTLSWGFTVNFNNEDKTGFVGNAFYQRIA
jgi:hypothetical protein